jgi:acyl-coenzyme A thioesterase PaaI-like protein
MHRVMKKSESLSAAIQPDGLFWGQPELQAHLQGLDQREREGLYHAEVLDWVSSIYWGETLGVQYALEMSQQVKTDEEREFWRNTLAEEVDHQQRISSWLGFRGHAPNPPNRLLQEAMARVHEARQNGNPEKLAALILWGQVFFEELGAILIRWRLPHVVDRELKAILYKIYSDEMVHISAGKRALQEMGEVVPSRNDVLNQKAALVFPLHLIPKDLVHIRDHVRRSGLACVRTLLNERIPDLERYRVSPLLQRWMKVEGYNCIGCHPKRSEGLLLDPSFDEVAREAVDTLIFSRRFEGMNDLVHGGFISMALDEVMGYAINHQFNRLAFTTELKVQFSKPVKVGRAYRITGSVENIENGRAKVRGSITDPQTGAVLAQSEASFFLVNEASAAKLLPGALATPETRAMLGGGV